MRALSPAVLAAVDAVITSPGHLVYLELLPTPARWSDIGQVTTPDGNTWAAVDMDVQRIAVSGDRAPAGFTLRIGNLDSAIAALLLANDLSAVPLSVFGFDRGAIGVGDFVKLGTWHITNARIGIDDASITCAPILYTVPFRRVDAANGFNFATPAGTQITWGTETLIMDAAYDAEGRRIR